MRLYAMPENAKRFADEDAFAAHDIRRSLRNDRPIGGSFRQLPTGSHEAPLNPGGRITRIADTEQVNR